MQIDASTMLTFWGIPSAVTGFGFWWLKKNITERDVQRDAKREELDKARKKNEILLIHSVGAAIALGEATAHALKDGKCNGEMTKALEYAQKVKHEQKDFMTEQGIENLY